MDLKQYVKPALVVVVVVSGLIKLGWLAPGKSAPEFLRPA